MQSVEVEIFTTGVPTPWSSGLRADTERIRIKDANGNVLRDIKVVQVDGDDIILQNEQS